MSNSYEEEENNSNIHTALIKCNNVKVFERPWPNDFGPSIETSIASSSGFK